MALIPVYVNVSYCNCVYMYFYLYLWLTVERATLFPSIQYVQYVRVLQPELFCLAQVTCTGGFYQH